LSERAHASILFRASDLFRTSEKAPEDSGPFLRHSHCANLVAGADATGHRSTMPMNLRDLHRAVAASIRATDVDRNSRTVVVAAPVAIVPPVLRRRWRNNRNQRYCCQRDKSSLHLHSPLVMTDKRIFAWRRSKTIEENQLNNCSGFRFSFCAAVNISFINR